MASCPRIFPGPGDPVNRPATLLWEVTRHILVWYFARLSKVNIVYGSLTTAIVVLLSLEIAATLLLLGAQVISEYERLDRESPPAPQPP